MVTRATLLPVKAVSYMLGHALGVGKQWVDALNDYRQEHADIHGLRLYPFSHTAGTSDRVGQPLYRKEDVRDFIEAVRAACGARIPFPLVLDEYEFDPTPGPPCMWKVRLARKTSGVRSL